MVSYLASGSDGTNATTEKHLPIEKQYTPDETLPPELGATELLTQTQDDDKMLERSRLIWLRLRPQSAGVASK